MSHSPLWRLLLIFILSPSRRVRFYGNGCSCQWVSSSSQIVMNLWKWFWVNCRLTYTVCRSYWNVHRVYTGNFPVLVWTCEILIDLPMFLLMGRAWFREFLIRNYKCPISWHSSIWLVWVLLPLFCDRFVMDWYSPCLEEEGADSVSGL